MGRQAYLNRLALVSVPDVVVYHSLAFCLVAVALLDPWMIQNIDQVRPRMRFPEKLLAGRLLSSTTTKGVMSA